MEINQNVGLFLCNNAPKPLLSSLFMKGTFLISVNNINYLINMHILCIELKYLAGRVKNSVQIHDIIVLKE